MRDSSLLACERASCSFFVNSLRSVDTSTSVRLCELCKQTSEIRHTNTSNSSVPASLRALSQVRSISYRVELYKAQTCTNIHQHSFSSRTPSYQFSFRTQFALLGRALVPERSKSPLADTSPHKKELTLDSSSSSSL